MFEGLLPHGFVVAANGISSHFLLFTLSALWLFWCAGYIPKIKHKWFSNMGMAVITNMVLTSIILLRVLGIV